MKIIVLTFSIFFVKAQDTFFDESLLYGRWIWIESYGGLTESRSTARETGFEKSVLFTKDHNVFYFLKDSVTFRSTYICQTAVSLFSDKPEVVMGVRGFAKKQVVRLTPDTLWLRENVYDGFTHVYVKMK